MLLSWIGQQDDTDVGPAFTLNTALLSFINPFSGCIFGQQQILAVLYPVSPCSSGNQIGSLVWKNTPFLIYFHFCRHFMPDESHIDASSISRKETCIGKNDQPGWDREEVFALIFLSVQMFLCLRRLWGAQALQCLGPLQSSYRKRN